MTFERIQPGAAVAVEISGVIREGVPDGTLVPNQALISAEGVQSTPSDDPETPWLGMRQISW